MVRSQLCKTGAEKLTVCMVGRLTSPVTTSCAVSRPTELTHNASVLMLSRPTPLIYEKRCAEGDDTRVRGSKTHLDMYFGQMLTFMYKVCHTPGNPLTCRSFVRGGGECTPQSTCSECRAAEGHLFLPTAAIDKNTHPMTHGAII